MRALLMAQGTYYLVTGLWPLASMRAFEAVTGPKTDKWLVKTVGVLVSVVGGSLLLAARANNMTPASRLLALGSAAGLAAIDLNYATKGRISRVYLLDSMAEAGLIALALATERGQSSS